MAGTGSFVLEDEPSSNPFTICESLRKLHRLALASKGKLEVTFEDTTLAVAILDHGCTIADFTDENFHWFKLKPKHSVAKLKNAYLQKTGVEIVLKHPSRGIWDGSQMQDFIPIDGNILVFTSEAVNMASNSASTPIRNPLQPRNTQLTSNVNPLHPADGQISVKQENSYASPYAQDENSHVPAKNPPLPSGIKNENRDVDVDMDAVLQSLSPGPSETSGNVLVKDDSSAGELLLADSTVPHPPKHSKLHDQIQKVMAEGNPEELEAEVGILQSFLKELKQPMVGRAAQHKDAKHWVQQIETLEKHKVDTPTIIGVVGNTGAGKSSVINAMLEEERLVGTNCMRACTACVTEISWNKSEDENSRYRAEIEFIRAEDWKKDLELSLNELLDSSGQVSRDCANPETEAGVAYAKIKSVYPQKTKDDLASSTVEQLMREPAVRDVLGTTKNIAKRDPDLFYKALQHYVDSKEKTADKKDKDKKKEKEKRSMEFWPLIKVVRIYTKSDCLSTGAVIVDLPGVHDSNAARAAVAAGYMKQCTGLFIVAPINRAVDDKAAKSLLGESFKRQMKFDGTYSRITFICSKTDDISLIEATDSLGLQEEMSADWEKIDALERQQRALTRELKELRESKGVYTEIMDDCDEKIEQWDSLKDDLEAGKTVYSPDTESKKRKRSPSLKTSRKKSKKTPSDSDDEDDIEDESNDSASDKDSDDDNSEAEPEREPLTAEEIDAKLATFKEDKKKARSERNAVAETVKEKNRELKQLQKEQAVIETTMTAVCIEGRNSYSKGAIQRDFADGIRELDQEAAQMEDPDQFNPEDDLRDYEEVARSLPVFCVSSRAYQKIQGRLQRDNDVPGFRNPKETEVPQLQAHCKKLTEAGRASNCRIFLTQLCQLLTSLGLWAGNDGTGMNLSDAQMAAETRFLKNRLKTLDTSLQKSVTNCLKDIHETLAEQIFENLDTHVDVAVAEANDTVGKWHRPVNRENRPLGGFYYATYKAIMRREGVFSNAQGPHDFNSALIEPIIKRVATYWEKCFQQRLPRVFSTFTKDSKSLLTKFHGEIELRAMKTGTGAAGMMLLQHQLANYGNTLAALTQQMNEMINELQRDANREFTPVIARTLNAAYDHNANECGTGCFARMKSHMTSYVDEHRNTMFSESCHEVKQRLVDMCKQVEEFMAAKADGIFIAMQRDYMEVVSGTTLPKGQSMPVWERNMRSDVAKSIEEQGVARTVAAAEAEAASLQAGSTDAAITSELDSAARESASTEDPATSKAASEEAAVEEVTSPGAATSPELIDASKESPATEEDSADPDATEVDESMDTSKDAAKPTGTTDEDSQDPDATEPDDSMDTSS